MSNSKGMSAGVIILIVLAIILTPIIAAGMYAVSVNNTNVEFESKIQAFNKASESTLSNYTLKIQDMAQVPNMYKDDLMGVIDKTFQGRYGSDGSRAVVQFMNERNIPLDSSLYKNLQIAMEAGRNEFNLSQTRKFDVCSGYQNQLGYAMSGMTSRILGFPRIDIKKECQVVSDSDTRKAFDTGIAEKTKLR